MFAAAVFSAALTLRTRKYAAQVYKERKQVEQEQYRANLLRSISHDLRTPLVGIMGTSEMIMDMSEERDPRRELASDIYQDANWLHELVENILGLTRLQDGKVTINQNVEALEEILGSAVSYIEKRYPDHEIDIELPRCSRQQRGGGCPHVHYGGGGYGASRYGLAGSGRYGGAAQAQGMVGDADHHCFRERSGQGEGQRT